MEDSAHPPDRSRDVHLVLLLHGLYGSPANLWCLEEELLRGGNNQGDKERSDGDDDGEGRDDSREGLDVVVLNAKSYVAAKTWDGIDVNAERVAEELDAEIARLEDEGRNVAAISITGYSLGGLIARALVGQLHARSPSFFDKHKPAAFATIATPHLGVLRYGSWRSQWLHALGQRLFSRTGQQLYCLDTDHGSPFLAIMAHPDRIYVRALSLFRSITIFANGVNDLTVPYCTAAICDHDPFVDHEVVEQGKPHVHVEVDGHIVCSWGNSDPDDEEVEYLCSLEESDGENIEVSTERAAELKYVEPPPLAPAPVPVTTATGLHSQRPWFPPVFYLNRPGIFRFALFPFVPLLLPVFLSFVAITFAFHSFQSSQRLRVYRNGERRLVLEVEDGTPTGYGATAARAVAGAVTGTMDDTPSGASTPQLSPASTSQPLITPLQQSMINHLSSLPLERVIAWFPSAFNAHAVIIARNARNPTWAWQGAGRQVVRDWAGRVISAATDAAASE